MNSFSGSPRARWDRLRALSLPSLLRQFQAVPDPLDPCKWRTPRGVISIREAKFFNWTRNLGGGGAIDLAMHLLDVDFSTAIAWLERHGPLLETSPSVPPPSPFSARPSAPPMALKLPAPVPDRLASVKAYLISQRRLPGELVDALMSSADLYADARSNAVFVMRRGDGTLCGAELRGTRFSWRGMALGSSKDSGVFGVPSAAVSSLWRGEFLLKSLILCESAIDAISCWALHPEGCCVSVAGARPNPAWLDSWHRLALSIFCGYDADATGEAMAQSMILRYPRIQRLRPSLKDWNDVLRSARR